MPYLPGQSGPGAVVCTAPLAAIGLSVFLGIDQSAKFDDVGHRIQIERIYPASQSQCFERNRSTTSENIEDLGRLRAAGASRMRVGNSSPGLQDRGGVARKAAELLYKGSLSVSLLFGARGWHQGPVDGSPAGD